MDTNMKCRNLLLKTIMLVLFIFSGMAIQTADADAASYEFIHVSDLKTVSSDGVGKTQLKSGGYIWVGKDFDGADHHDVYYQKKKGGDIYLILDYFDLVDYCDVIITNGQKFYYADQGYTDGFTPQLFSISELNLGSGRKILATAEGIPYGYGYKDNFTMAGYYNGYLYYSLSGSIYRGAEGQLYKLNVKTGKTTRVSKNFSAFSATGSGRYIYGYTTDTKNCEKDKFVIYDCKLGKKVRTIDKDVYYAKVMNGKLYFYEDFNPDNYKYGVYQASLSGKDRKRILQVRDVGDMYKNSIYYGLEQKDGSMQYYRYSVKTGKKYKISQQDFQVLLDLSRAEFGYKN